MGIALVGQVTGARLVGSDGRTRLVANPDKALKAYVKGLVELTYDYGPSLLPGPAPSGDGMWRYRRLLPVADGPIRYPLAVGGTPLVAPPLLRKEAGMDRLFLKDETRSPTGSNKDRATALVLEWALQEGITTVTAASTGNVAVSLAIGCAACGLTAVIFVPASVAQGKLRLMLLAGATVFKVEEGYEAAFKLSRAAARKFGWGDRNTGVNPLTVEAKKTVAIEIWEQLGRRVPHAVVVPVGDATTLSALLKGFRELRSCGATERMPRLIGVQAEGMQPLRKAWRGEEAPVCTGTIADGIAVTMPVNATTALRDVKECRGCFVAVSDEAILRAIGSLASRAGVLAEPAAAASYAGLQAAIDEGLVRRDDTTVLLVTGTGLKTPQHLMPGPGARQFAIGADLDEVESALRPLL